MYNSKYSFSNAILILLLAAVSNYAEAEWINISTGANGTAIYADPSTIQKSVGRTKMWILFDYRKMIIESGDKIMSMTSPNEWIPVVPSSISGDLWKYACS